MMSLHTALEAWIGGICEVIEPTIVLLLAWALGDVIAACHTAPYIASALGDNLPVHFLPFIATAMAYIISFATGSGAGTMGIMFPLLLPLVHQLSNGDPDAMLQATASILGGAVFGNTCSPIADTSILTQVATGCKLEAHIQTCLPYSLLAGFVCLLFGSLPVGMEWYGPIPGLLISLVVLSGSFWFLAEPTEGVREEQGDDSMVAGAVKGEAAGVDTTALLAGGGLAGR